MEPLNAGPHRAPCMRRSALFKTFLLLLVFTFAGCGKVEWLPEYQRLPTTPDSFSFAAVPGTEPGAQVTSAPITVSGLTGSTSPISVTGSAGGDSKYSVNGGTPTNSDGTVQNGDKVTVTHTAASTLGTTTTTTLSIGSESAQFISTTRYIEKPSFTLTVLQPSPYRQAMAVITSVDGVLGTHVVSIKDSLNSGKALYGVSETDEIPSNFFNDTRTFPYLNGRRIFVRNLSTVVGAGAVTTLTIDGLDVVVNLAQ
ncbi:hypothetical protein [Geomonas oryzae]|uniref:hypothetical protein n=1 Tax=Geomonas oryzae TaxID=2364273 RepID=UPI001FEBE106|nr:hypothetical protein [Geomonas oryzae]